MRTHLWSAAVISLATAGTVALAPPAPAVACAWPDVPRNVTAVPRPAAPGAGPGRIRVTWAPPAAVGDAPVSAYVVQTTWPGSFGTTGLAGPAIAVSAGARSVTVTGLPALAGAVVHVHAASVCGTGPAAASPALDLAAAPTSYVREVVTDRPSAYYRLGERTGVPVGGDSSDRALVLRYTAAHTGVRGAVVGDTDRAARGSGAAPVATVNTSLPISYLDRSVEAWVKAGRGLQWFAGWGGPAGEFSVGVDATSVQVRDPRQVLRFALPAGVRVTRWNHVAVSASRRTVTVFVNGAPLGTQQFDHDLATGPGGLVVGGRGSGESPFTGALDELAIYQRVVPAYRFAAHVAAAGR